MASLTSQFTNSAECGWKFPSTDMSEIFAVIQIYWTFDNHPLSLSSFIYLIGSKWILSEIKLIWNSCPEQLLLTKVRYPLSLGQVIGAAAVARIQFECSVFVIICSFTMWVTPKCFRKCPMLRKWLRYLYPHIRLVIFLKPNYNRT